MTRDNEANGFLDELGAKVKLARARRGMSRKLVSEISGVSPRYIAQLENGKGNISVVLLRQISQAISVPLETLFSDIEPMTGEIAQIVKKLQTASPLEVARVQTILGVNSEEYDKAERYVLIGLRGAGKSTLGRMAARELNYPFVELNAEIERQSGMAVDEIFALYGQEGYRKLEKAALDRIACNYNQVVLAAAGGVVSEPETYDLLMSKFVAIWLRASPDEHMSRVMAQGDKRPMADNPEAMEELKEILTSREALYARAPMTVDTSERSIEESRNDLIAAIRCNRCAVLDSIEEGGARVRDACVGGRSAAS
ncbi:XRE family aerobic/anaerobic benzoate catabolism transcriptional regulator [Rhodobium gokarnense]|uniref:Shikimate kinase n=1 Tax=Rhodobium gokarnense TaxID=364296 RepID=A0ABT3HBR6_9HYPH|nr:XRE family aerobic/anaerobic benzoate catabolism transcriptional regulator [Rhodobium gokarnense]